MFQEFFSLRCIIIVIDFFVEVEVERDVGRFSKSSAMMSAVKNGLNDRNKSFRRIDLVVNCEVKIWYAESVSNWIRFC